MVSFCTYLSMNITIPISTKWFSYGQHYIPLLLQIYCSSRKLLYMMVIIHNFLLQSSIINIVLEKGVVTIVVTIFFPRNAKGAATRLKLVLVYGAVTFTWWCPYILVLVFRWCKSMKPSFGSFLSIFCTNVVGNITIVLFCKQIYYNIVPFFSSREEYVAIPKLKGKVYPFKSTSLYFVSTYAFRILNSIRS